MKRISLVLVAMLAVIVVVRRAPAENGHRRLQLVEASIAELDHALRSHVITSEQLVQMYQARIAAYDKVGPTLNAILHLNDHALDDARARDRERRHDRDHGR